jgi:hypothetical protein
MIQRLIPALQVCPYDIEAATELCELLAELGEDRQDREFWIVFRADTNSQRILQLQRILNRKFKAMAFGARTHGDGWPAGSNALWYSTMVEAWHRAREGWTMADGIFTFEPDCVPLTTDWFDRLEIEWIKAMKPVVGHVHHTNHINGNAMFDMRLLERHAQVKWCSFQQVGWDWINREYFMQIGADTPLIWQRYQCPTITETAFLAIKKDGYRPAILHGVKDGSARVWARKHLVPQEKPILVPV